jgi:poly-beta-1,6-N-acetyl-D-glucosamine synthase
MPIEEKTTLKYVLITPAKNEAAYIGRTLESMVAQTVKPLKWVVVSDGSTDGTDEIVKRYAREHHWIKLIRMPERSERSFSGKVDAFNAGYALVRHLDYFIIGNLDGDASFERDYLEYLLHKFAQNPRLGVAGTNYWERSWENSVKHDYRFTNDEDVSGLCQLFRRECFEAIGGYQPSRQGGVDLIASIKARMNGWETRMFSDKCANHLRQQGTAEAYKFMVELHNGRKDYVFGGHPLWEMLRATYRLTKKPYVIGGCFIVAGYFWAMVKGADKTVSDDIVQFRRSEQMTRLARLFRKLLVLRRLSQEDEAYGMQSE